MKKLSKDQIKCPKCDGTGALPEKAVDDSSKVTERFKKCPKCKGKGYILKSDRWSPR